MTFFCPCPIEPSYGQSTQNTLSKPTAKQQSRKLTRIRHNQRRQTRERLIGRNIKPSIIQGLDLVVLDVVAAALLPVLDAEAEAVRVVLRGTHQERASGVHVCQEQLVGLLPRHVGEEPAGRVVSIGKFRGSK